MDRITDKRLNLKVDAVNGMLGMPDPVVYPTPGQIVLGKAYGGVRVEQVVNSSGGISVLSNFGYGTKRQADTFLSGMIAGMRLNN